MTVRKSQQKTADDVVAGGMFIGDREIIEKHGAEVLQPLDADPRTQKDKGTRPAGARYRPDVEKKLAEISGA